MAGVRLLIRGLKVYIHVMALFFSLAWAFPSLAAPAPIKCDPKNGIWNFGLEWVADSCVPADMTWATAIHYTNNAVVCNPNTHEVELYAPYGDDLAAPSDLINNPIITGYRIFANSEGTHIVAVHPDYVGTIDDNDMTAFSPETIHLGVFKTGFILPKTPHCKKTPECTTCPCTDIPFLSTVNIVYGALSHNQNLFALTGGTSPLSVSLNYLSDPVAPSAIGNGWSHSYEESLQILSKGSVKFWINGNERDYRLKNDGSFSAPVGNYATLTKNLDSSYTLVEKSGIVRRFDPAGVLTSLVDRAGNATSFTYLNNRLSSVTDPSGRKATFSYDVNGRLSTVADPMGNQYVLSYTNDLLSAVTHPDGGNWKFSYGSGNTLVSKTDPGGNATSYSYDNENRVTSGTDPQLRTRSVDYSGSGAVLNQESYPMSTKNVKMSVRPTPTPPPLMAPVRWCPCLLPIRMVAPGTMNTNTRALPLRA